MGENTAIEWADHTFNPWSGCTKVSPGCANCYAERLSARGMTNGKGERTLGQWGPGAPRKRTSAANWRKPLRWDREAEPQPCEGCCSCSSVGHYSPLCDGSGLVSVRPRVFCASLADWLDPEVPAEWLADLLALIERTPHLDWLLLTKRPELWRERLEAATDWDGLIDGRLNQGADDMVSDWLKGLTPANVWIGTSVEDQQRADERIPHLLRIPARVRFLSCEPLLGPVTLPALEKLDRSGLRTAEIGNWGNVPAPRFHWVIAGGESGPGARPMHPEWVRSLRDQCQAAGVAFHFKQWGEWAPGGSLPGKPNGRVIGVHAAGMTAWTTDNDHNPFALGHPGWRVMSRVGKKTAGRHLDGRTWDEVPS